MLHRYFVFACAAALAMSDVAGAENPKCAPGYLYVGGHPVLQQDGPAIWVGGQCISVKAPPDFKPVGPAKVYPAYYLLTILYAVPGEASEAKYGTGSSLGSRTEDTKSFKAGIQAEVETNFFDITAGYASTSKDGQSFEVKREQTATLTVSGVNNSISHDQDMFYLWTNPELDITQVGPSQLIQNLLPRDNQPMVIVPVTARELKNPSLLPDWKKTALSALKDSDRTSLLSMDPFFSQQTAFDRNLRFVKFDTLQLDGPDNPGDPVTGQGLELDSEQTRGNIKGTEQSVSLTIMVGGEVSFGIVSKVMVGADLEWTWETTTENSNGTLQKFEVALKTAVVGYHSVIDVYEDTLFNSLVFLPAGTPFSSNQAIISGLALDADGKPLANALITVALPDGQIRRVFSNAHGIYRIFRVSPGTNIRIGLRGHEQVVSVTASPMKLDLRIPKGALKPPVPRTPPAPIKLPEKPR